MSAIVDTLVEQARVLPEQDKLALLDALFGLVSPSDPSVEHLWIEVCEQRAAAIDRGEMSLLDADEVMMKYRQ
ncbi:MAG: addiction module protein [Proteobacteria bacterium]|nr:addiction module protein [Pseudomonadota bacterium]